MHKSYKPIIRFGSFALIISGVLFIALSLFLLPIPNPPIATFLGCSVLGLVVANNLLSAIALGRLVYPVYGIEISTDMLKLMFSLYVGSQHMMLLLLCVATVCLSVAIWRSSMSRLTAILGFAAAIMNLLGSYPWVIGNVAVFVTQVFHALWWIWLGVQLLNMNKPSTHYLIR